MESDGARLGKRPWCEAGPPCKSCPNAKDDERGGHAPPGLEPAEEEEQGEAQRRDPHKRVRVEVENEVESQEREAGARERCQERRPRRQPAQSFRDESAEELDRPRAKAGDDAGLPCSAIRVGRPIRHSELARR